MSVPFSRSVRSLEADSFRLSLLSVAIIALFLLLWVAWFLFAQVTLYEVSQDAVLSSEDVIIAHFPAAALGRLQPGQWAEVRLDSFPWARYGTLGASVIDVSSAIRDGQVEVRLRAYPSTAPAIPLQEGLTGTVEVVVGRASPAALVLQAAGVRR